MHTYAYFNREFNSEEFHSTKQIDKRQVCGL